MQTAHIASIIGKSSCQDRPKWWRCPYILLANNASKVLSDLAPFEDAPASSWETGTSAHDPLYACVLAERDRRAEFETWNDKEASQRTGLTVIASKVEKIKAAPFATHPGGKSLAEYQLAADTRAAERVAAQS
jgi:hypothetical protein